MADGVSVFDGLIIQGNNLLSLLTATKNVLESASLDTTNVDNSITIINTVLPMAYEQIELVAGNGNTDYYFICNECSLACKSILKFDITEDTYCRLKKTNGAKFNKYDTVINA